MSKEARTRAKIRAAERQKRKKALKRAKELSSEDKEIMFSIFMDAFGDGQERDMFDAILETGETTYLPNIEDLLEGLNEYKTDEANNNHEHEEQENA